MNTYTVTEARQNLGLLLNRALREGGVWIKQRDGRIFIVKPAVHKDSPLHVEGLDLNLGMETILECIEDGRRNS